MQPKVSVVMSVYNGSLHLRESIDSILNQTFTDFEFIIIDDGSTDLSCEIVTEYSKQDSRIKLFKNEVNIGLTKSLNKGLKLARGEYIARQDGDDVSLSTRFELQVEFLNQNPEICALGTSVDFINQEGVFTWKHILPVDHESLKAKLLINNDFHHSTLMARRDALNGIGGYDEKIRYAQDYDLWWRLSCVGRLACLPNILVQRRIDSSPRITNTKRYQQLSIAQNISYHAIQESSQLIFPANSQSIDKIAYKIFWWSLIRKTDKNAYQDFLNYPNNDCRQLQYQDIRKLQPLWILFINFPQGSEVLSFALSRLIYDLLSHGQIREAIYLTWVMLQQLKITPKALSEIIISALKVKLNIWKKEYFLLFK